MNIFSVLKFKSVLFYVLMVFYNISLSFCGGNLKLSLYIHASLKSLTNSENPSSNPLQEARSCFMVASVTLKVVPKAACDSKKMFLKPAMTCTLKKK